MVTEVEAATALVVTENVALVAPAAMVTLAGTWAAALVLDSMTTAPPAGAGPFNVTLPVGDAVPPVTLAGLTVSDVGIGGTTVIAAAWLVLSNDAEIVIEADAPTALVLMVKVAVVAPSGTVTPAGTLATPELLLDSATRIPSLGAAELSVTVPVDEPPPVTLLGLTLSDESEGPSGLTVSDVVRVSPL